MVEIARLWRYSELAQAAYAHLPAADTDSVRLALKLPALGTSIFAGIEADRLIGITAFSVVDLHANANDAVGFSATLFRDNRSGDYVLALRGTEPATRADLEHSLYEIALWGVAAHQIVSAYNYVQRLITPRGEPVKQLWLEERAGPSRPGAAGIVVPSIKRVPPVGFVELHTYYADNAIGTLAEAAPGTRVSLAGHSLGGHLAQALLRLFPQWFDRAYAYNSAGFYPVMADALLRLIDPAVGAADAGRISNVYSYPQAELITNTILHTQYGERLGVWIEDQLPDITGNHSIAVQARSLAVHALFAAIDPGFDATPRLGEPAFAGIDALLRALAPTAAGTLAAAVATLARLVLRQDLQPAELAGREAFYERLFALRDVLAGHPGALRIESLVDLSAEALQARAASADGEPIRYALAALNPFAVSGFDYAAHNPAGELALYDPATGRGELTDEWLRDRAELLSWVLVRNRDDIAGVVPNPGGVALELVDRRLIAGSLVQERLRVGASTDRPRTIAFGSPLAEALEGSGDADSLYGGDGEDRLAGLGGDDDLQGDAGNDFLAGGAGDDTLVGGKDTDCLLGGAGADRYRWRKGDGEDYAIDFRGDGFGGDGEGTIEFLGHTLAGTLTLENADASGRIYTGPSGLRYAYTGSTLGRGILTLSRPGEAGSLSILGFRSGELGLLLDEAPPFEATLQAGTAQADILYARAPRERVFGYGGNDRIHLSLWRAEGWGGEGDDYIRNDAGKRELGAAGMCMPVCRDLASGEICQPDDCRARGPGVGLRR